MNSGGRDSSLLEHFGSLEKITHFDHERIPERIVHTRGSGASGYFEVINPIPHRHFALVKESLARAGTEGERAEITPYQAPGDLDPSPALSLVGKAKGRKMARS